MNGAWLLAGVLAFLALQRLGELALNRANVRRLVAQGGRIVHDDAYWALIAVHASLFVLLPLEWAFAPWSGLHRGTWLLLGVFAVTDGIRLWSTATLGRRWTTKVVVLPGAPLIRRGPYRFLRHPIYDMLRIELFALPLAFGLVGSALVLGTANLVALHYRARAEDAAWAALARA